MSRFRLLILIALLMLATSCSSIRGDRVETGFGTPVSATDATPGSVPADSADLVRAGRSHGAHGQLLSHGGLASDPIELGQNDASASFDFEARELYSGSIVNGLDLLGQGEVLVTFVQPGCDIVIDGSTMIASVAKEHPEATFVIVHSGGDDDAYMAFAEEAMLFQENMVHLSDTNGDIAKRYSVDAYPTTLLIDSERRITAVAGVLDEEAHREAVATVTTRTLLG